MPPTPTLTTLPSELLEKILGLLPLDRSLLNASLTHPTLHATIRSPPFWKQHYPPITTKKTEKTAAESSYTYTTIHAHVAGRPDEWTVHWAQVKHKLFGRNLLRNPFGIDSLTHWKVLSGDDRVPLHPNDPPKSGWSVLNSSTDAITFPDGSSSSWFSTDEHSCSKEQTVDLWKLGFTPAVMRAVVPFSIRWGVGVSTPPANSGGFYDLQIRFLNHLSEDIIIEECPSMTQSHTLPAGLEFRQVGGTYSVKSGREEYEIVKSGMRYVHFYHGGMAKGNETGRDNGVRIWRPMVWVELG